MGECLPRLTLLIPLRAIETSRELGRPLAAKPPRVCRHRI